MARVLILGAGGMLGSALCDVLGPADGVEAVPVARATHGFDARGDDPAPVLRECGCDWAVNAIGVLRPGIDESDPDSVENAFAVNAEFPRRLAEAAAPGQRIVHVSTDAVFSGAGPGPLDESREPDASGVYGRSKAAGEVDAPHVVNLRCSIVGRRTDRLASLLDWALDQPPGATVSGYSDHLWNGLTALHLSRLIAAGISDPPSALPNVLHLVPGDDVVKAELIELALASFGRDDVTVERRPAPAPSDTRLATRHPDLNRRLWAAAGYERAPTIAEMVRELAAYCADGSG